MNTAHSTDETKSHTVAVLWYSLCEEERRKEREKKMYRHAPAHTTYQVQVEEEEEDFIIYWYPI